MSQKREEILARILELQNKIQEMNSKEIDTSYEWDEVDMLRDMLRDIPNEAPCEE
jgi:hypothetical protein